MSDGRVLDVTVDRPVAGGAMLGRLQGQVVLVTGAIPGERVRVKVERTRRDVIHARVVTVLEADPDRRPVAGDPACGGQVYRHIAYARQLRLKSQVIQDALGRIAKLERDAVPVMASPEHGYRMRARLRLGPSGLGFFREGTHTICNVAATGQLATDTASVVDDLGRRLIASGSDVVEQVDLAENLSGGERVFDIRVTRSSELLLSSVRDGAGPDRGWTGLSVSGARPRGSGRVPRPVFTEGTTTVRDPMTAFTGVPGNRILIRQAGAFFQSNRYLVPSLVRAVGERVTEGPVVDLYAGVGLFALAMTDYGHDRVTAVERDPLAVADLTANAAAAHAPVNVIETSVEAYLTGRSEQMRGTVIVDPPRAGLSRTAVKSLGDRGPSRLVYVSCDVPTFARDVSRLAAAGYAVSDLVACDMFPHTAHVELVAALQR